MNVSKFTLLSNISSNATPWNMSKNANIFNSVKVLQPVNIVEQYKLYARVASLFASSESPVPAKM